MSNALLNSYFSKKQRGRTINTPPFTGYTHSGWRYADAIDVAEIPNASLGDYIIDGANIHSGGKNAIDARVSFNNDFALSGGSKILIKGDHYNYISLELP